MLAEVPVRKFVILKDNKYNVSGLFFMTPKMKIWLQGCFFIIKSFQGHPKLKIIINSWLHDYTVFSLKMQYNVFKLPLRMFRYDFRSHA